MAYWSELSDEEGVLTGHDNGFSVYSCSMERMRFLWESLLAALEAGFE